MFYGVIAGDTVVITSPEHGKPIQETTPPNIPNGYKATYSWNETFDSITQVWELKPEEGTKEDASLRLSKLQARSLPDNLAYDFRALFDEWIPGMQYYKAEEKEGFLGDRVLYQGDLYKVLQDHVAEAARAPGDSPTFYQKIIPETMIPQDDTV